MITEPVKIITSGNMAGSLSSSGLDMFNMAIGSIQAVFTGSPVGTLKLQISNDIVPTPTAGAANLASNVVNWTDYTGSSQSISAAGNFMWILDATGYRWLRLVYTFSSGTGTLNVTACNKGA